MQTRDDNSDLPAPVAEPRGPVRWAFTTLARLGSLGAILLTASCFLARYHWAADLVANLRIQVMIGISGTLLACLIAQQFRLAALTAGLALIHLLIMAPQLSPPSSPGEATEASPLRLMTINVLTSNSDHDRIAAHIVELDADVVAVIELSSSLQIALEQRIGDRYPYSLLRPQDLGNFGMGLYSKSPLASARVFQLNESIDSIEATCQGVRVIATHPLPPMGSRQFLSRNEHLRQLAQRVADYQTDQRKIPTVVMGDLNLTPWSPIFAEFERRSGLIRARRGLGIQPTWYARGGAFPFGLALDHVLIDPSMHCRWYQVGSDVGSDHRSVTVDLSLSAAQFRSDSRGSLR
ncbi:endonuclease/exonuclease/phosphatase family protein [Stieleria sp. TO1_6]|uniref:endonuclease/exonuclease/phosphatase family protein n=1 Tax=Stieleria tagensis TaxID=2956795 RepID=UPI00209BB24F|nr:endonuclease/exonuclease/phosphatase family protein [Stieleria tagensis]MCO8122206.1 endonuclease/exonuclease/phosphatase family protein [Stieleria tagensis]